MAEDHPWLTYTRHSLNPNDSCRGERHGTFNEETPAS